MSRFLLDDSVQGRILKELPNLEGLFGSAFMNGPDWISMHFHPESPIPIAAVCLQDAFDTLFSARYALHEFFAHKIWYSEKKEPPDKEAADAYRLFYADDVTLRLYSAAEHLANAIISMMKISEDQLKKYRKGKISQQSIVGSFLAGEELNHPITKAVLKLHNSKEWCKTIGYRNRWVHEQPPTVAGLGIIYERRERWLRSKTDNFWHLPFGGGDQPEYTVDELLGFIQPASFHGSLYSHCSML